MKKIIFILPLLGASFSLANETKRTNSPEEVILSSPQKGGGPTLNCDSIISLTMAMLKTTVRDQEVLEIVENVIRIECEKSNAQ